MTEMVWTTVPQQEMIDWEQLRTSRTTGGLSFHVYRARVPRGWFVYVHLDPDCGGGVTFYPDPEHKWDGKSLPEGATRGNTRSRARKKK